MLFRRSGLLIVILTRALAPAQAQEISLSSAQVQFRAELAAESAALEKQNVSAAAGTDGWLFLASELRFLSKGRFWGEAAATAARSTKSSDPLVAILDFHRQLRERGIELLLVPVPPKATIYPGKIAPELKLEGAEPAPYLQQFYRELRAGGVEVLDLEEVFSRHQEDARGPVFCRTDSHWSGAGCVLAAQAIAERLRSKLPPGVKHYAADWKEVSITGDLAGLLGPGVTPPPAETIAVRAISEPPGTTPVQPDANSPLLLMGDSHTLVFHDFLTERAGLLDQLANELGFAPDLIGTRGSGATAVRVSLYRRSNSDPGYLARKKVIVWCFAAREFTEADQGWVLQSIAK